MTSACRLIDEALNKRSNISSAIGAYSGTRLMKNFDCSILELEKLTFYLKVINCEC